MLTAFAFILAVFLALGVCALSANVLAFFVNGARAVLADKWFRISTLGLLILLAALIAT